MMPKWKPLLSILLGMAVVFAQVGAVYAAPPQQDGTLTITGTVQDVVVELDPLSNYSPVVVFTLLVDGATQTVTVTLETAISKGWIVLDEENNPVLDENGLPVVIDSLIGTEVSIDIIPDAPPAADEPQHPVASKITEFFSGILGVNYDLVMGSHTSGFGFGVISQALYLTQILGGDASVFEKILFAKEHNDYTGIEVPGEIVPQNWGQFKKIVSADVDHGNLGDIMSGEHGKKENSGNGKPENPGNGNGKPENPGNGNVNSNRPVIPPGQDKEKDKDNTGNNNNDSTNGNGRTK